MEKLWFVQSSLAVFASQAKFMVGFTSPSLILSRLRLCHGSLVQPHFEGLSLCVAVAWVLFVAGLDFLVATMSSSSWSYD